MESKERTLPQLHEQVERLWDVVNRHSNEISVLGREIRADNESLYRRVQTLEERDSLYSSENEWKESNEQRERERIVGAGDLFRSIEETHQRYQTALESRLPLTPRSITYMRSSSKSDLDDLDDESIAEHSRGLRARLAERKKKALETVKWIRAKKKAEETNAERVKEEREKELERLRIGNYHYGRP